ncbi:glucosyltransferase domain-containing protein [Helicobacter sp. T3_23-1056]
MNSKNTKDSTKSLSLLPKPPFSLFAEIFSEFRTASLALFQTQGFWKYFLIAFSIYLLGILSLIRADVYYIDDLGRAAIGYKEWDNFSRYISWFLSTPMHMSTTLSDIAPLTQLVAIAFLSFASVILVWSVREIIWKNEDRLWESSEIPNKKRLTVMGIIASVPIGLSPYFLEELSFRFDSPYMALSVLFSVIPFVFIHHIKAYIPVSFLCSLGMCMTYQASSGIEVILVSFFAFLMLNQTNAGIKKTLIFVCVSMCCYLLALGVFKLFIMHPFAHDQASTEMYHLAEIPSGFVKNVIMYVGYLWNDFGWSGIKICFFWILGFFVLSSIYQARVNKAISTLLALAILAIGIVFSYGTYLVLVEPLTRPRAFIGIGVFSATISVYVVSAWRGWAHKKEEIAQANSENLITRSAPQRAFFVLSAVVAGFFSWSLIVFANSYGNALAAQNKYLDFRFTLLLDDLVNSVPKKAADYQNYLYRIKGWVTASPVVENSSKDNRIMKRLVDITDSKYWVRMAMKHYGWGDVPESQVFVTPDNEDHQKLAENPHCIPESAGRLLKRVSNIYHQIEVYPHCTIIEFKGKERYLHDYQEELEQEKLKAQEEKLEEQRLEEAKSKQSNKQKAQKNK